jgi:hypothetical protein
VEVDSEALSVGALCERVAAPGYDGMYDARSLARSTPVSARQTQRLRMTPDDGHKMDKSEQQLHQDLKTREVRLLVPLISRLSGGEAGGGVLCRYRQWLVLTPDGKECLALKQDSAQW